jgi:hypothetical protein
MNRRNFLSTLVGGIAVGAVERMFPFRVFSFASKIERPKLKVYFFKDLEGALDWNLGWEGLIVSGVQLDAIARIHGVERRMKIGGTKNAVTDLHIDYLETDADLRQRVLAARFQNGSMGIGGVRWNGQNGSARIATRNL